MPTGDNDLLQSVRRELAPAEGSNLFVPLVLEGKLSRERIVQIAGEEYHIMRSDRRSFLQLAARFPDPPAGAFYMGLAQGEDLAYPMLLDFAAAFDWSEKYLEAYEPLPRCQAYAHYVAWMALNGAQADVAIALVANFAAWGSYCGAVAEGLRRNYDIDDKGVAFLEFFAVPTPEIEEQARAVVQASVEQDVPPESARRMARMVQAYELSFWNELAEGVDH